MGEQKMCFENSRGHLTYVRRAAGCVSLFYRHLGDRAREGEEQQAVIRYAKTRRLGELGDPNPNITSHPSSPSCSQPMRVITIKSYFKLLAGRNELNRGTVWHNFLTKVDVSCSFTSIFRYFFSAVRADERKCPIMTYDMNIRKRHSVMLVHYYDDGEFLPTTGLKCENLPHKPCPHLISLQFQRLHVYFSRTIVCYFN